MKIRITKIFFMSAEYIDLYLFKNISISEFPELSNLKGLCIHNVDIEEADISNLQNYKFLSSELYKICCVLYRIINYHQKH